MKKLNLLLLGILCLCGGAAMAQYRTLLNFNGSNGSGCLYSSLTTSGNTLYGVSTGGGGFDSGVAFSIDTTGGGYSDLHDFHGKKGAYPVGSLIIVGNTLFGTCALMGAHDSGCIFSMHKDGSGYRDLFDFSGGGHGREPIGAIIVSGNKIYGTTNVGGGGAKGLIFSVDTDGTGYSDLHDFLGADGSTPFCQLLLSGNVLYGVTPFGGLHDSGVVFSVHTDGSKYKDLYDFKTFTGYEAAGALAISGGTLFGAAYYGGALNKGLIFSIDTDGTGYANLHSFTSITGSNCYGNLTVSGTTVLGLCASGGIHDSGCIFSIQTNGGGYNDIYDFDHTGGYVPQLNGLVVSGETMFGLLPSGGTHGMGTIFSFKYPTLSVANITVGAAQINVYPNPNNGEFTLKVKSETPIGNSNIAVYNVLGEQVYTQRSALTSPVLIDMSNQPNGIYLYKIISENGTMAGEGKLVIQK